MKNTLNEIYSSMSEFFRRFGALTILMIISYMAKIIFTEGVARGVLLRSLAKIPMAALIGLSCYILLLNHTEFKNDTCVAITCVSCAFTGEIYDIIIKMIKWIPEAIKALISKKLDIDNNNKNNEK